MIKKIIPEYHCDAIPFKEREAAAYDEKAVRTAKENKKGQEDGKGAPLCSQRTALPTPMPMPISMQIS